MLCFFFLHCLLSGPVLIYISLLIISCIIEYVTNKRTLNLYKGKFKMLTLKTIMSQIQGGDWFVTIDLKDASHLACTVAQEVPSVCLWREGLPIQGPSLWPGLGAEDIHEVHGCCAGPFEAPGHSHAQLLRHRDIILHYIRSLGLRMNTKKSVLFHSQQTVFWGFTWIPFRCRPVWLLPRFSISQHVWPASS